ncbi:FecR family protein [Membranihabitans maritimus]|uniref:FecR family protein n=1 Tax=Membranihabitans maritimus TaxID=2904244 RepID=UPI001F293B9D|nr:FecR domain-containing protein [Membranihabitans maritimus]
MTKQELSNLIEKYLKGVPTVEESYMVEEFYNKIQADESGWEDWSIEEKKRIKQRLYNRIKSRIKRKRKMIFMRRWAAAAVLILMIGSVFLNIFIQRDFEQISEPPTGTTVVVAEEMERTVLLEDGSYVYLEEGSQLVFPDRFNEKVREVELIGQALFDIQKDSLRPFSVFSGTVVTEVLGTTFSISALPRQQEVMVSVSEGKVRVLEEDRELGVLVRDEGLTYNVRTKSVRRLAPKPVEIPSKESLEYKLVDVTMEEAVRFIENRWKYRIDFENENIRDCKVVASFYEQDSLEEVLTILCGINNVQYRIENQKVVIYGDKCR